MRMFRAALTMIVTALLTVAVMSVPAYAANPKRIITETRPVQVNIRAFVLKGLVTEPLPDGTTRIYANRRVKIQKRTCRKCRWKVVRTIRTNDNGKYRTRIKAPLKGRWRWRARVPASSGYAVTVGRTWVLYLR